MHKQNGATGRIVSAAVAGVSLLLATVVAGWFLSNTKLASTTIRVKGFAARPIVSDFGIWKGQVTVRHPQIAAAYARLAEDMGRVAVFLQERHVMPGASESLPVQIEIRYRRNEHGQETGEIDSYTLSQILVVRMDDVRLLSTVFKESTQLIKDGVEFRSFDPEYYYTKLDSLKIEMLGEATRDAQARAHEIAVNGGIKIGRLKAAQQGIFQITPRYSTEISSYGMLDTSSIEKTIRAIVDAEFSVR